MMFSLQRPVRIMARHLSEQLASHEAIEKIERIADWFPAAITGCFCFELELAEASSNVDLSFLCNRDSTGAEILAGFSSIELRQDLWINPIWNDLRGFFRTWAGSDKQVRDCITHVWFEFDSDQLQQAPVPCIYLGLPRNHPADMTWLIPLLKKMNYPVSRPLLQYLEQSSRSTFLAKKRMSIGLMFSRNINHTRLVFHELDDTTFSLFPDPVIKEDSDLMRIVTDLLEMSVRFNLSIDVGESLGPRIGLECLFTDQIRTDQASWTKLLDYLVSLGCCPAAKRDAVLHWPGGSRERFPHLLRPAAVARKIKHLKIVYRKDSLLEAKAYLFSVY